MTVENKHTKQAGHFQKLSAFAGLWIMREKEQGSEEEAETHIYTTNFTYLPENRQRGKVRARVSERFNIELWSIKMKKEKKNFQSSLLTLKSIMKKNTTTA